MKYFCKLYNLKIIGKLSNLRVMLYVRFVNRIIQICLCIFVMVILDCTNIKKKEKKTKY